MQDHTKGHVDHSNLFTLTASLVVIFCQFVGWLLSGALSQPIQVLSTVVVEVNLVRSENHGMNFGMFAGDTVAHKLALISVAVIVCLALAFVFLRKGTTAYAIAGGMIVGGGMSNVLERLTLGYVFDYLNTPVFGMNNPFSYNLADIFIVLPMAWWVLKRD